MTGAPPADPHGRNESQTHGAGDGWSDQRRAAERTQLSWRRTVLSALAVMLLAISKVMLTGSRSRSVIVAVLMVTGWLGIVAVARYRMATMRDGRRVNHSPALVALLTTAYAALAATLVL